MDIQVAIFGLNNTVYNNVGDTFFYFPSFFTTYVDWLGVRPGTNKSPSTLEMMRYTSQDALRKTTD